MEQRRTFPQGFLQEIVVSPDQKNEKEKSIGVAWIENDGTIKLNLRATADGGIVGTGLLTYSPAHAQYRDILAHIGPIQPGQRLAVKPWDD